MQDKLLELAKMSANSSGSGSLLEKGKKGNNQIQKLEESLVNIQESIKIKNGYEITLKEVDMFIARVESIDEQKADRLLVKEEKISLIATAKQFQQQIIKAKEE